MEPGPEHFQKLERMYVSAPINAVVLPSITVEEGGATVAFEAAPALFHSAGALHGSLVFKALDDAAFFAAQSLVLEAFVLTVQFTVYFLRPIAGGTLRASGHVTHRSRRLLLADAEARDADGRLVGRGTGQFMTGSTPLTPEIGYR